MKIILNETFLRSIVLVKYFSLSTNSCEVRILCIEDDKEINYSLLLTNIAYAIFRQEYTQDEFEVIDTILERFNDSEYVNFMKSDKKSNYWILRFHSGIHHLLVGFENLELNRY